MKKIILFMAVLAPLAVLADADIADVEFADVESYDAESSVFQKIADLEQEKVLMQLEKEKAQLQLDLDRLAAEQSRLAREQETAEARAEEQAAEIEKQKLAIEQERKKLDDQKKRMAEDASKKSADGEEKVAKKSAAGQNAGPLAKVALAKDVADEGVSLADRYALIEIIGAGTQLFATVEDLANGRQKKLSVGKLLDGYSVRSISLDDGVEFEKDGDVLTIGVGSFGVAADEI